MSRLQTDRPIEANSVSITIAFGGIQIIWGPGPGWGLTVGRREAMLEFGYLAFIFDL